MVQKGELDDLRASGKFDAEWYLSEYPDVAQLWMDPAEHYLWLCRMLGRSPARVQQNHFTELTEGRESHGFRSNATFVDFERADFARRLHSVDPAPVFKYRPKISVLVPAYKSPIIYLDMAVKSVIEQSYDNWELIVVDDGSGDARLASYLKALPTRDNRIKIQINEQNGGISVATNCCLSLASGEFIALFDHDDILTLDALSKVVEVLNRRPDLDLIYTDECRVNEQDTPIDMFRKPDWSSAMLLNYMYTGHFSVYRRHIVERAGGFRSEFDFSQDYDLALRVTELTQRIYHIPELLYGWRAIAGSGAAGGKDYARDSNIAALGDAMRRRNILGRAVPLSTANRVDRTGEMPCPSVSIIIPSDNVRHISEAVKSIIDGTQYSNFEIVVVTNSRLICELRDIASDKVRFAAFDAAFNFSAKCNVGADAASGDFYCFFNDDVRPITRDWIETLLEYGLMSDVGAVGAKLLYEDGKIQHAGMVTGVRNLVGTAFHSLPADTSFHFNMAQCVRDVSLLCGALILMPRGVFHAIGGWDEVDFAIAHSDVDLCLKVRAAGLRCVYTPYACLHHIGHVSIGHEEKQEKKRRVDKADIALLRKWPEEIANDPFFPMPMRRQVYHDSQEYYAIYPGATHPLRGGKDILLISHELSRSGAPMVLVQMAAILRKAGHFVVVIAPEDGPARHDLVRMGVTVIVDELVLNRQDTFKRFARNFDIVLGNTIVAWPALDLLSGEVETIAYIHEGEFMRGLIDGTPQIADVLNRTSKIFAVSDVPGRILEDKGVSFELMPYGFDIVDSNDRIVSSRSERNEGVRIVVMGSYEPRKAQDLAIIAVQRLEEMIDVPVELRCFGRTLDKNFRAEIETRIRPGDSVMLGGGLDHASAIQEIAEADILLVSSRDDPLPIVATEAMALGKIVVTPAHVGTTGHIVHGESGFVARSSAPEDLAETLAEAIGQRPVWADIADTAQAHFRDTFTLDAFARRLLSAMNL